jgi:hypothetical protein
VGWVPDLGWVFQFHRIKHETKGVIVDHRSGGMIRLQAA